MNKTVEFPNEASKFVYYRTYSRWIEEKSRRENWNETVDRYIEFLEKQTGDRVPQKVFRKAKQYLLQFSSVGSMRAIWAAGEAAETNHVTLYNCLTSEAEFISSNGVKSFNDCFDGQELSVLTHSGNWKNAVVRKYGTKQVDNITFKKGGRGSDFNVKATPDHRWILSDGSITTSLSEGDNVLSAPSIWNWDFGDATPEERLYWAYGYVYGDGTVNKTSSGDCSMVRLCNKDRHFAKRFEDLGFKTSSSHSLNGDFMAYSGSYKKTLPDLGKDPINLIKAFMAGFMDADGTKNTNRPGEWLSIQQSGEESIEFLRKALPMCGLYILREDDYTGQETNFGIRGKTSRFVISENKATSTNAMWRVVSIDNSGEEETWCLEVEDDQSFVMPNGITTGNCAYQNVDCVDAFAECLYILMCGTGYGFSVEGKHITKLPVIEAMHGDGIGTSVIEDSKEGWADSIKHLMTALYAGKDLEFDYSLLRPKGARLKKFGGRSSGPAPLISLHEFIRKTFSEAQGRKLKSIECLDLLNKIAEIVVVGGVRRSSEISLSDLEDQDMSTAKNWPFPLHRAMSNNSAVYYIKPGPIVFMKEWANMADSGSGERGIVNLEGARLRSPERRNSKRIDGVNPCQPGYATVLTPDGIKTFDDIEIGSTIWSGKQWTKVTNKVMTGVKDVYEYRTTRGRFIGTPNHKIIENGERCEAKDAKAIDSVVGPNIKSLAKLDSQNILDGLVIGDGGKHKASNNLIGLYIGEKDQDYFDSEVSHLIGKHRPSIKESFYEVKTTINHECLSPTFERVVPDNFYYGDLNKMRGFLRGLFSANGCVNNANRIELKQSSLSLINQVQDMLSALGISSYITHNKPKLINFNNGDYVCKDSYAINITSDRENFMSQIGFIQKYKQIEPMETRPKSKTSNIKTVEHLGQEAVYDITVEAEEHTYWTGGCLVSNCAEILLRSKQFCNLTEVVVRAEDDLDDVLDKIETATWLGAIQSTLTKFPYLSPQWAKNCIEERLLGVSLTGQMDNYAMMSNPSMIKAMKAKALKIAKKASKILGINFSAAVTCVKPSGCQKKDTILLTSNGILSLEEIGDTKGETWQNHNMLVASQSDDKRSTKFFVNGKAKTKKIHMRSGIVLESTHNHQYKTLRDAGLVWSRADEIQEGDVLPYKIGGYEFGEVQSLYSVDKPYCNVKEMKQPGVLCEKLAYIIGLYVGDGSNHNKGIRIAGNAEDMGPLNKAKGYIKDLFGLDGIIYKRTQGNNADLYINSTWLKAFLSANGLTKNKTDDVDIPLLVRKSTTSVISAFIDGYRDADGHITKRGEHVFCTISKKMSEQLPVVLRALGSVCSVKLMPPTKTSWGENMRYRITTNKGWSGDYSHSGLGRFYFQLEKMNLKNQYVPDVVDFIEDSECETFDIEVPENNRYIANSYISHNTVSQLVNSSSGLHPRWSTFYIRRYRIASIDPLFKMMKSQGLDMTPENGQRKEDWVKAQDGETSLSTIYEKGKRWTEDKVNTWVVSFPIKSPEDSITREQLTAMQQLEHYKLLQENWCEHNASATIYVKDDEWLEVGNWVYKNWDYIAGVSFLPFDSGAYEQAPYEEVDEKKYNKMLKEMPIIDYSQLSMFELEDGTTGSQELACGGGGSCEIK